MIDARLHGEMQRADPRVYARPFQLRRAQSLTPTQIIDRLNDLGYSHRARTEQPGEFTVGRDAVLMIPRDGDRKGQLVRIAFGARGPKGAEPTTIDHIDLVATKKTVDRLTLDPPLITALITSAREKRRDVPLAAIPERMIQAVLAIEDRRFYDHAGVDPIAHRRRDSSITSSAARRTCAAASTLTQQLVKNTFLTQETLADAEDHRVVHVDRARAAADEGPGPRALSE